MAKPIMNKFSPKNKGSKQLFNNKLLESLTKTHAAVPITLFIVVGITLMTYGIYEGLLSVSVTLTTFLIGFFLFTLIEYCVHRFLFHLPPTTEKRKELTYKFHGVHHEFPKDKQRLAMPVILSITLVGILYLLFSLTIGDYVYAFLPGIIVGYSAYLSVHYVVHARRPPKNFLKILWIHHGIHHYKRNDKAFGVSSPLWDYIFGTMP